MYASLYAQQDFKIQTTQHDQIVKQFISNEWYRTVHKNNEMADKQLKASEEKKSEMSKLIIYLQQHSKNTAQ